MKKMLQEMLQSLMGAGGAEAKWLIFSTNDAAIMMAMWNGLKIVALAMTLVYFLIEMNRKYALEGGDMTFKSFFAPFLKLVLAIGIISQGAKILGFILELNNAMINAAGNMDDGWFTLSGTAADLSNFKDILKKIGIEDHTQASSMDVMVAFIVDSLDAFGVMKLIVLLIPLLLGFIVNLVLKLVWWYKSIMYKLELAFRLGVTPIALADIYSGQSSTAIRYLKGFLALGIYAVALVALAKIATQLAMDEMLKILDDLDASKIFGLIGSFFQIAFVCPFAALSCASTVKTIAKEALGA